MVLILLPLAFFNWEKDFISKIDNRKLTNFPSLETINTDTVETFNKYLSDRLGFREEMITWYSDIHLKMFHTLVHRDYIYGEDDYIFFDIYQKSYNEHTDKFVQTIQKLLSMLSLEEQNSIFSSTLRRLQYIQINYLKEPIIIVYG